MDPPYRCRDIVTAVTTPTTPPAAPDHLGVDLLDGAFYGREPHDAYAWMRDHAPVYYDQANDLWAAASYHAVKAASVDTESFSSAGGIRPKLPQLPMMIDFDAPEHVRRRRLVSEGFTPKRVREMEGHLHQVCDAIIDQVCERGSCDFVADIAAPLPIIVIGDMLGVAPADRDDLLRWSDDMLTSLGSPDPSLLDAAATAFVEYTGYINPVFEERRRRGSRDDLVGVLCHAEIDGDSLDDDSLIHETLLILIGGDETTRHVISGGVEELLAHPDQRARLAADPDLMSDAVEEMLRWVSPIKNMARTATRDVELEGAAIRAGQELILLYPSANRDAAVFEHPDQFDISRHPNPHMAFGFGAHFCLGNQLARLELKVMVERLLARLPDLHLTVGRADLPRRPANFISGIVEMPVAFTPTSPVGAGTV
jgi:cholest-4-en-3-one 26-monooxygenase